MDKTAIALGFFDGVHTGHAKILKTAAEQARLLGIKSAACTFSAHPHSLIKDKSIKMITDIETRKRLISAQGIDRVIVMPFDKKTAALEPREFADILKKEYGCVLAVCGEDFRFGNAAAGSARDLEACGIKTVVCEKVLMGDLKVSSTLIRGLVAEGDVKRANEALGRPFSVSGKVESGFKVGREMGFPTANIKPPEGIVIPAFGVYAACVKVSGARCPAVCDVGVRPTFGRGTAVSIESHILDFEEDIYGQKIEVEFLARLREEKKFENREELMLQIERDKTAAKKYFAGGDKL